MNRVQAAPAHSGLPLPANLVPALRSILDPVNLAELFPRPAPLEVELGSGDGSFLMDYAAAHPERNFLGIERLLGRIRKLDRKGRRRGLANLRGLRIESAYFLHYLLPPASAGALHIYFPDPWPKLKHRRHRLINERFPALARRALVPGGVVYLRTDDADYFAQMRQVFAAATEFREVPTPPELLAFKTDFETEFNAQGIPTRHVAYQFCG